MESGAGLKVSEGVASPDSVAAARVGRSVSTAGDLSGSLALQSEVEELRQQLQTYAESMPAVLLDPSEIAPARWANRHEFNLQGRAFQALKDSINLRNGNVEPILVRPVAGGGYEIVYGRRRCRACRELGLRVRAVIWNGELTDRDHFLIADAENRVREEPSPYEQGVSYLAALDAGLFPSRRRLAEASGVSHTWVNKAISVAELPSEILDCCVCSAQIQPRHALALATALGVDRKRILERTAALKARGERLPPAKLVEALIGSPSANQAKGDIQVRGNTVGGWKLQAGRLQITVQAESVTEDAAHRAAQAVVRSLAAGSVRSASHEPDFSSRQLRLDD